MRRRLILQETRFTRWRFFTSYFIDVDTFYLFLNWFSTRVSDDQKYLSGSRLYACINTRKFKGLDSREATSLPDIEKVIYMVRHINHRQKQITCSSKDSLAYSESLQHPTIAILLIANSRLECTNHTLFQTKMVEIDTLFQTKTAKKTIPFGAAHTYIAYVRD